MNTSKRENAKARPLIEVISFYPPDVCQKRLQAKEGEHVEQDVDLTVHKRIRIEWFPLQGDIYEFRIQMDVKVRREPYHVFALGYLEPYGEYGTRAVIQKVGPRFPLAVLIQTFLAIGFAVATVVWYFTAVSRGFDALGIDMAMPFVVFLVPAFNWRYERYRQRERIKELLEMIGKVTRDDRDKKKQKSSDR